jgi:pimeloyl-ACP methyl ester carboxylesterase
LRKIALVVISLLAVCGIAGFIVFLVLYIGEIGRAHSLSRECDDMKRKLALVELAGNVPEIFNKENCARRVFVSHTDGNADMFGVAPVDVSLSTKGFTLIVYLHGMGSSFYEPFFFPKHKPFGPQLLLRDKNAILLSCNYRKSASWGTDPALADITQNIRELCEQYPVAKIVLAGTSMGGCTSLNYAATCPGDIKARLVGIVSVEGSGDLAGLFHQTNRPEIQQAMIAAFGGTPEQVPNVYASKSFLTNVKGLPKNVRVCIVSASRDTIIVPEFQAQIAQALDSNGIQNRVLNVNTTHGVLPAEVMCEAMDYACPL